MISVLEAERSIAMTVNGVVSAGRASEEISLAKARGRILAEDVRADRDYPPFHRVSMDGVAVSSAAWTGGLRRFRVAGVARAGEARRSLGAPGEAIEVGTGSVLPDGTDVVVPYELFRREKDLVELGEPLAPMSNVHSEGADCSAGCSVLNRGMTLLSPAIGIAASFGHDRLRVRRRARVAIVSTGDELVPIASAPEPHQIRVSNSHALRALLLSFGDHEIEIHHFPDSAAALASGLGAILPGCDFLLLSGGVSMGKFDLIPGVLADLKVRTVFHRVSLKPGKPMFFGQSDAGALVFGLPGNPMSALVCARRFVVTALRRWSGVAPVPDIHVRLSSAFKGRSDLTVFAPVVIRDGEEPRAFAIENNGSGDFVSLAATTGFVELALGHLEGFPAGTSVPYYSWDGGARG